MIDFIIVDDALHIMKRQRRTIDPSPDSGDEASLEFPQRMQGMPNRIARLMVQFGAEGKRSPNPESDATAFG